MMLMGTSEFKNRIFRWLGYGQKDLGWAQRVHRDQKRLAKTLPQLLKPHFNCIDIGAHQGAFLKDFQKYCPQGQHLAFEPLPDLFDLLVKEFPTVQVYKQALTDQSGKSKFYQVKNAIAWSGLAPQDYPMEAEILEIEVEVQNLDLAVPQNYRPDFIKIDVEGAELQVLRGGSALIGTFRPTILFEHAAIHNSNYQTSPEDVFDFFDNCNMEIRRLDMGLPYNKDQFSEVYYRSHKSNYNHTAETNFIAIARPA